MSLWKPEGEIALEYLRNKRNISDEVLRKFQIGYCPREKNHFLAGRILMPVFDAHDNLVAFSTRDWQAPKEFQHWHESFDKGMYLFGLNVAKKHIQWNNKVIIVEGQFDAMCLHSNRLPMTVSILGTSLSIVHINILARYCSEFYFLLDDDRSGRSCVDRSMKLYKEYSLGLLGLNFIITWLPDKLDPDEFVVKYGTDSLTSLLLKKRKEVING